MCNAFSGGVGAALMVCGTEPDGSSSVMGRIRSSVYLQQRLFVPIGAVRDW